MKGIRPNLRFFTAMSALAGLGFTVILAYNKTQAFMVELRKDDKTVGKGQSRVSAREAVHAAIKDYDQHGGVNL